MYLVMKLVKWSDVECKNMPGVPVDGMKNTCGFLPIYYTLEEAERENPGMEIREVKFVEVTTE